MKKVYRQINNLKIVHDESNPNSKWTVKTPDGRAIEEFDHLEGAVSFATNTKDFTKLGYITRMRRRQLNV